MSEEKEERKHIISVIIPSVREDHQATIDEALDNQIRKADEIIKVWDHDRRGPAWARNRGIEQAKGDLILFLDDDCIPDPDWIQSLTKALSEPEIAYAGQRYEETDPMLRDVYRRKEKLGYNVVFYAGGNVGFKREWLEKLREQDGYFFNEEMMQSQDHEILWRIDMMGGKGTQSESRPKHLRRTDFWSYLRFQYRRGIAISNLQKIQKKFEYAPPYHQSIAWGQNGGILGKLGKVIWKKVIGPLDWKNFSTFRHFAMFWLGEKFQLAGYAYAQLFPGLKR